MLCALFSVLFKIELILLIKNVLIKEPLLMLLNTAPESVTVLFHLKTEL